MTALVYIGSLLFWGYMLAVSLVCFPIAALIRVVTAPFDRRLAALHMFSCFWASLYLWANPLWGLRIEGRDRIDRRVAYVMVCNHQSLADIIILFRLFVHFKWVSKAENFRIPLVGWNMRLNRYISIQRGSARGNLGMVRGCETALRQGSSVMIFPEGTRSPDGALQEFRQGAFEIALRTQAPVLPIVIDGTATALPKRGFLFRGRHSIRVRVLQPLAPPWPAGKDAATLRVEVHGAIARELQAMREGAAG
ncbi:MAG TPA: lysophospholipid acyltransferase family protein [Bacteroidota bacterium]|nr:lysophospholipid acyltransferase family protein [Bacteroidota bacterium]